MINDETEYAYYVTSADPAAYSAKELMEIIRGHWRAIENGSHQRRDVTLHEDASRIAKEKGRHGAHVMATLRNIVIGLFEWQKHRGQAKGFMPGWRRKMTGSQAIRILKQPA